MERLLAMAMLGCVAVTQMSVAGAKSEQSGDPKSAPKSESASVDLSTLPPAPRGKSTILGGEIRNVDSVRDELTLKVSGQKRPTKILFDERTQAYRDGKGVSLRDLRVDDHATVQTVLDGTDVFALSIRLLSRPPEGDFKGHVLNYNRDKGELTMSPVLSHESIKLLVPVNTRVDRGNQSSFSSAHSGVSDLVRGSLISVRFNSNEGGRGVASQITILATPGSDSTFSGRLSALDMHSGLLVLVDPRDDESYQVFFDSARLPISQNLHEGDHLRVTAVFDGARYVASAITVY